MIINSSGFCGGCIVPHHLSTSYLPLTHALCLVKVKGASFCLVIKWALWNYSDSIHPTSQATFSFAPPTHTCFQLMAKTCRLCLLYQSAVPFNFFEKSPLLILRFHHLFFVFFFLNLFDPWPMVCIVEIMIHNFVQVNSKHRRSLTKGLIRK